MPSLATLPTELIVEIAELLPPAGIKNFSSTSRRLRHAVTYVLFRTLNIACPLVSHQLLDYMLKKYERVITRIHLHIYLRPNLVSDFVERGFRIIPVSLDSDEHEMPATPSPDPEEFCDEVEMPVNSIWGTPRSDTLEKLVRGQILTHVSSFSVHFDPCQFEDAGQWYGDAGDWGDENGTGGISVFEDGEDDDDIFDREPDYVWREHYNQVFKDLTKNPNITKLRFINLLPKRATVWYSQEWVSMLKRLTHFDIGIFGATNGRWSGDAAPGFIEFIEDLPWYIGRFLENAKHLRLEASTLSVFGTDIARFDKTMFPLHPGTSDLLSLELKNIVLGPEFLKYLRAAAGTLRELTLRNCMCISYTRAEATQWSEIWKSILTHNKAMKRVIFLQDERPPLPSPNHPAYRRSRRLFERLLRKDKDLIVWSHIHLDRNWTPRGKLIKDMAANLDEVCSGRAYRKYRELMRVLAERREKDESSSKA